MITSTKKILEKANKGGYAVGAFNVNNLEMLQAVIAGAEKERAPVIIQTSEGAIAYAGMNYLVAMVKVAAKAKIPVALHLDHGKDIKLIKEAARAGYTSVMFDGSTLSFETNIRKTKEVVGFCHRRGVSVEAELGAIAGMEDFVNVKEREAHFTHPEQAKEFVKRTRCDFLAVSVGTAHGAYKFKEPYSEETELDIARIAAIKENVKIPLVLHGASAVNPNTILEINRYGGKIKNAYGIPEEAIVQAVRAGINKINTDSDLRLAFTEGVRRTFTQEPESFDPRRPLTVARDAMEAVVRERIRLFGSKGKK